MDINCDLGEGVGNDHLLMPFLSSCNIACGGHAGDEDTMRQTIQLAKQHRTKIGAHPSFPDKENFGRTEMRIPSEQLTSLVLDQIETLDAIAKEEGAVLNHVKPHGALYNMATVDKGVAEAVVKAVLLFDEKIILYAPYGSVMAKLALEQSIRVMFEAFADRNYNDDLTLVSRKLENAVIQNPEEILTRVLLMIKEKKVKSLSGQLSHIQADTLCIHGDNSHAVDIVSYLNQQLPIHHISIAKIGAV
ncbi:MAG: 5-oxoprolinase subunit PxpA [Cyclobacteriaceae bacterium]|nr:5-oxoprolinase subunit PxpA [Cyclobacteriaceae bacterium]